jgi:hypothetical protein
MGNKTNTNLQILEQISGGFTENQSLVVHKQLHYLFLMDQLVQFCNIE